MPLVVFGSPLLKHMIFCVWDAKPAIVLLFYYSYAMKRCADICQGLHTHGCERLGNWIDVRVCILFSAHI